MPSIAIIGAGFSGSLTALHLLRASPTARVTLVDRSGRFGPGLAYATPSPVHFLNVPAGNMSAFDDDPGHFLHWAQQRDPAVTTGSFLPRGLYGQYLQSILAAERSRARVGSSPNQDRLRELTDQALSLDLDASNRAAIRLRSGTTLHPDRVVLALGNAQPPNPAALDPAAATHPAYIRNPWESSDGGPLDRIRPDEPVAIIGTGLTMMDVVMSLAARDHAGPILALSRHGLIPRPHRSPSKPPAHRDPPAAIRTWDGSARSLLHILRAAVRDSASRRTDWRDVISSIRHSTPDLWHRLDARERARFLNRLCSYWNIVRHRAAPETAAAINDLIAARRLTVRAARISTIAPADDGRHLDVAFRPRGSSHPQTFRAARVINALGPDPDLTRSDSPLVEDLLLKGLITPDPHHLGAQTTEDGHALDATGKPTPLLIVGPWRRAIDWEATAVPELRTQAAQAARTLLATAMPAPA